MASKLNRSFAQNYHCFHEMWKQDRDKMLDNERLAAHARMAEVAEKYVILKSTN